MPDVKLGLLCWNQQTDWDELLDAGRSADRLGFDTLWAWDHLYPIAGEPYGPFYDGWLTMTAWAMATERIRIGLMVGANPYRSPALVAKMASVLDQISHGRAILGIGAAWNVPEARAFGIDMGSGPAERLRWLSEALPIMRGMLDGTEPSGAGDRYPVDRVRNDPPPVQPHLPILIGGGGEKVTLRLVARYADMNNVGDGLENVRHKEEVLLEHCRAVGRDPNEIERTVGVGVVVIRDSRAEAERVFERQSERNRIRSRWTDQPLGTPEDVAAMLAPYLEIGYRHFIVGHPAPYDEETEARLVSEVRPILERQGA